MSSNPYKRLRGLFPEPRLDIGKVTDSTDGVVTYLLPDGSQGRARGSATVGKSVFIRSGLVESEAPDLEVVEIRI